MSALPSAETISWRRVGALSTSFSLHGVAIALALAALTAPLVLPVDEPDRSLPDIVAEFVEPEPLEAPPPPVAEPVAVQRPIEPVRTATIEPATERPAVTNVETPVPAVSADAPADAAIEPAPASEARTREAVAYDNVRLPRYPSGLIRQGLQGETLLRVRVGIDGRPARIEIERSSGHRELDRAALAAVRRWRFHPATEAGQPVPSWVIVPVGFRLD